MKKGFSALGGISYEGKLFLVLLASESADPQLFKRKDRKHYEKQDNTTGYSYNGRPHRSHSAGSRGKDMKYHKFRKPFIRFSKAGHYVHPHVIVGEKENRYVSVNLTHHPCSFYGGRFHSNKRLKDNPEISYMVTGGCYLRDKDEYFKPNESIRYSVSKSNKDAARRIVRKTKKPWH